MSDVDSVGHDVGFDIGTNCSLAVLLIEVYTRSESFFGAEFPRVASTRFLIDEDRELNRDKRGGILV